MQKDDTRVDHAPPLRWLLVLALACLLVSRADGSVAPAPSASATSRQPRSTLPGSANSRLLVLPTPGKESEAEALHQTWRARVLHRLHRLGGWEVVELPKDTEVVRALETYRRNPAIQFVEPDAPIRAAQTLPNDPFFQNGAQWHLNNYGQNGGLPDVDVDGPEAWDVVREAPGVIVAILDTGIRWTHEDLAPNLWRNPRDGSFGLNPIGRSHDPWDDNGHGTHVAGLIGAVANNQRGVAGVAWRVQLMAIKVLDSAGNGW
ncbi:MAG: S8 family serine peptidase, partial [Limisphaera sp.]|nr:S8 family serine peptidase [Limisphaera sp.]